jgi:hypothetical protein
VGALQHGPGRALVRLTAGHCQRFPDFLYAAPDATAYAAFVKESRKKRAGATKLHRKSGEARDQSRDSFTGALKRSVIRINAGAPTLLRAYRPRKNSVWMQAKFDPCEAV